MSLFSGMMAGKCMVIVPGTGSIDEFGQVIPGANIEIGPYRCYFFQPSGTIIDLVSGEHQKKALRVMLPANVPLEVGDSIRGLSTGYTETYKITSVDAAYQLDVLDHWECDLERVE